MPPERVPEKDSFSAKVVFLFSLFAWQNIILKFVAPKIIFRHNQSRWLFNMVLHSICYVWIFCDFLNNDQAKKKNLSQINLVSL